jgi:hypothetical protein
MDQINILKTTSKEIAKTIQKDRLSIHQIIWQHITPDVLKHIDSEVFRYLIDNSSGYHSHEVILGCITEDNLPYIDSEIIKILIDKNISYAEDIIHKKITPQNIIHISPYTLDILYTAKPEMLCEKLSITFLTQYKLSSLRTFTKNHTKIYETLSKTITATDLPHIPVDTILFLMSKDQKSIVRKQIATCITHENFKRLEPHFPWAEVAPYLENSIKIEIFHQTHQELTTISEKQSKLKAFIFEPRKIASYSKLLCTLEPQCTFNWKTRGITASEQHFHATHDALNFGHRLPEKIRCMLIKAFLQENIEQNKGRYVFFHYQPIYWWLRSLICKYLVEIQMNNGKPLPGYYPVVCLKNPQKYILSPNKADTLVKYGGRFTEDGTKNRILFMNYALFANSNNRAWGSNSVDLALKSVSWGKSKLPLEELFKEFGAESFYKTYQEKFDALEKEILEKIRYGAFLVISMTPEQVKKSVYVARIGGSKNPVIINNQKIYDVCTIY